MGPAVTEDTETRSRDRSADEGNIVNVRLTVGWLAGKAGKHSCRERKTDSRVRIYV